MLRFVANYLVVLETGAQQCYIDLDLHKLKAYIQYRSVRAHRNQELGELSVPKL